MMSQLKKYPYRIAATSMLALLVITLSARWLSESAMDAGLESTPVGDAQSTPLSRPPKEFKTPQEATKSLTDAMPQDSSLTALIAQADADAKIRERATDTIGKINDPSILPEAIALLELEHDPVVSDALRKMVGRLIDSDGCIGVVQAYVDSKVLSERDRYAAIVGEITNPLAVPCLADVVKAIDDDSIDMQFASARALARIGTKDAAAALINEIDAEYNPDGLDSNGRLVYEVSGISNIESLPYLLSVIQDRDGTLHTSDGRRAAVEAMQNFSGEDHPEIKGILTAIANDDQDDRVKYTAGLMLRFF